jgi:hypothetical protein
LAPGAFVLPCNQQPHFVLRRPVVIHLALKDHKIVSTDTLTAPYNLPSAL